MEFEIRPFHDTDCDALVEILRLNGQYDYPEVEGPEAMRRVARCDAAVFLVAVAGGSARGLIRAAYDGSRAMIHLLSVHPGFQKYGLGTALVEAAWQELQKRGATGVSATVGERSAGFWQRQGFQRVPVFLVLRTSGHTRVAP
jgi:ribosomal protein S18 acetylase RimI-like enzyme